METQTSEISLKVRTFEISLDAGGSASTDLWKTISGFITVIRRITFFTEPNSNAIVKFSILRDNVPILPFSGDFAATEYPTSVTLAEVVTGDVQLSINARNTDSANAHYLYLMVEVEEL